MSRVFEDPIGVVVVDGDADSCRRFTQTLEEVAYPKFRVQSAPSLAQLASSRHCGNLFLPDIVLVNIDTTDTGAPVGVVSNEALDRAVKQFPSMPTLVLTTRTVDVDQLYRLIAAGFDNVCLPHYNDAAYLVHFIVKTLARHRRTTDVDLRIREAYAAIADLKETLNIG